MDRESARQEIRRNWRELIPYMAETAKKRVNGEESYICPLCGHGKGGDGLTVNPKSADGNGLKCFACNFSGDIIDLYMQQHTATYSEALRKLAEALGITLDTPSTRQAAASPTRPIKEETPPPDYSAYYQRCTERLKTAPEAQAYLKSRGISLEVAISLFIGYDPQADPANAPGALDGWKPHPAPRIIIPTATDQYVARAIDESVDPRYRKLNSKGTSPKLFNAQALDGQTAHIFIAEGAFDAMAIAEAGGTAIALNSTANAELLLKELEQRRVTAMLILCLDADRAGDGARQTLEQGLNKLGIPFVTADICGGYKDPNEALTANREAFFEAVQNALKLNPLKPRNTRDYLNFMMDADIDKFKCDIKTGFNNLDEKAGGLYPGLYVLAAISSLGKTSFALQLADQLAEAGTDVLFFSLEMSRLELVSKSLSRRTVTKRADGTLDFSGAVTSLAIRKGYKPQQVRDATREYQDAVGDHVSIFAGDPQCTATYIGNCIRRHIKLNGTRPVCFIDYLQLIDADADARRQSVRENVDATVTALKRLSSDLDITLFVISSVNRANYLTPIDFESLKESGGVEYSADCVLGLQLQRLTDTDFQKEKDIATKREMVKKAKAETPRKIKLVCLKNRYGISSFDCNFSYYPASDLFTEEADFPILKAVNGKPIDESFFRR